ncbi:MAG: 2-isopropylmalate synthase [Proteocatella sp.]
MKRTIKIFDTTLRDGEQSPGCSMNLREKIEVAKQLEHLKVDVIEAGFAIASPGDLAAIKAISKEIKDSSICSLARTAKGDIDAAYEAIKYAASPRIHTFIATSPVHMEHKLRMTPDEVVERAVSMVAYAKNYVSDIEFSAEDACRSNLDFLVRIFEAVIKAGATTLNIPDTVGYITPNEMYAIISHIKNNVRGIENVVLSTHCHNDLGMAVANSLAAVSAGADQIECTLNGIGERAGNTSLEEVIMALRTRKDIFNIDSRIDTTAIYRASRLIQTITGVPVAPTKAIVGANAFAHESGIHQHGMLANRTTYEIMTPESVGIPKTTMVLGKHSGKHAFEERISELGYNLSKEEIEKAFLKFKILADKKKLIKDRDIEGIIVKDTEVEDKKLEMERFVINTGNDITSTAVLKIKVNGRSVEKVAIGDGPVNAAYKAVNKISGLSIELVDYSLHALTDGEDAQAEAIVKMKINESEDIITGRGISTDVVEASIKAYINGINKHYIA